MEYDSIFFMKTKQLMTLLGMWPVNFSSNWKRLCYKIYFTVLQASYTVFLLSIIIGMKDALNEGPMEQAISAENTLLFGLLMWKIILSQTGEIRNLIKSVAKKERSIMALIDEDIKELYMQKVIYNYKMFYVVVVIIAIGILQFLRIIYIQVNNFDKNGYSLDLPAWFPYDIDKYFLITYYHQVASRLYSGLTLVACDPLFFSLVYFALIRIRLLGRNLEHFQDLCNANKMETADNVLKRLILEHKSIIEYVHNLNSSMKWYFFVDFLVRTYHISTVLFTMMSIQKSDETGLDLIMAIWFSITYLAILVSQMHILYYHANKLRLESMEISTYIFQNNWYDQSQSCKQSFLIMMIRSQKPLEITIGNWSIITAELIVKIFKAGYTYILLNGF